MDISLLNYVQSGNNGRIRSLTCKHHGILRYEYDGSFEKKKQSITYKVTRKMFTCLAATSFYAAKELVLQFVDTVMHTFFCTGTKILSPHVIATLGKPNKIKFKCIHLEEQLTNWHPLNAYQLIRKWLKINELVLNTILLLTVHHHVMQTKCARCINVNLYWYLPW